MAKEKSAFIRYMETAYTLLEEALRPDADAEALCQRWSAMQDVAWDAREKGEFLPLPMVMESCALTDFEAFALVFLFFYAFHPAVPALYAERAGALPVTAERLRELYQQFQPEGFRLENVTLSRIAPLLAVDEPNAPLMHRSLRLSPRAIRFLLEGLGCDAADTPFERIYFPPMEGDEESAEEENSFADATVEPVFEAMEAAGEDARWMLQMVAPRMVDHQRYADRLAELCGLGCLHLDLSRVELANEAERNALVQDIRLECALYSPVVAIGHADAALFPEQQGGGASPFLYALLKQIEPYTRVVLLCAEREWRPDRSLKRRYLSFHIASTPPAQRAQAWRQRLGEQREQVDVLSLAARFDLDPPQMEEALTEARMAARMQGTPLDSRALYAACYHQVATNLQEYARLIRPHYQWDDLILADATRGVLQDACRHMQLREKVLGQWGFSRILPYGQSVSMVFMGPPGTGKTMAAQVMANHLGYEIYRVDISQMVSKYIGETEKNLDKIFDEAAKVGVILFFDEADALFARRTEVKDSHDKYANMESGFLLQRVEDYDGMVILATNHMGNMDEAFVRRMRFVVRFTVPDHACRLRMWREMLPEQLPKDPIDYDFLAERFELTGSDIKTILLHAAFHAAQQDQPLSMGHIVRSLRYHHDKINKTFLQSALGPYANLLE